jgi:dinuclear metal center YbgI/SA1388 family protein
MSTVKEIYDYLNSIAPVDLAEDYDNPGLLTGQPDGEVSSALLSLDITSQTANEAAARGAQLVISHHPVIFKPLRSVLSTGVSAPVWNLARLSLSAICMHTNLDAANGGVNDALAAVLGLLEVAGLCAYQSRHYKKITVFVPQDHAQKVRLAMAEAGAGKLGAYDGCAFEAKGSGYFRPLDGANPFIGKSGVPERVDELRIEAVCAPDRVKSVISAMLKAHPYEVPAYDIFDDEAVSENYSMGRVGVMSENITLKEFAQSVKKSLSSACVKVVDTGKMPHKIAVCGGSADESLITKAAHAGADTLVTGEMKHNLYYTALEAGINIVEAGHFATETVILPVLKEKLNAAFPQINFKIASTNTEPYYSVG